MIDLSKILSKYKKGWIALSPNNKDLLAVGSTLENVLEKARKKGMNNPTLLKLGPFRDLFTGKTIE